MTSFLVRPTCPPPTPTPLCSTLSRHLGGGAGRIGRSVNHHQERTLASPPPATATSRLESAPVVPPTRPHRPRGRLAACLRAGCACCGSVEIPNALTGRCRLLRPPATERTVRLRCYTDRGGGPFQGVRQGQPGDDQDGQVHRAFNGVGFIQHVIVTSPRQWPLEPLAAFVGSLLVCLLTRAWWLWPCYGTYPGMPTWSLPTRIRWRLRWHWTALFSAVARSM